MMGVASVLGGCAARRATPERGVPLPAAAWRSDLQEMIDTVVKGHVEPFHTITSAQLTTEVAALEAQIPNLSAPQIVVAFRRLLASIGDAHTRLYTPPSALGLRLPIESQWFGDGVYVVAAHHAHAELLGSRILEVDGRPVDPVVRGLEPIVSTDTIHGRRAEAAALVGFCSVLHARGLAAEPAGARLLLQDSTGRATERGLLGIDPARPSAWVHVAERWAPQPMAEREPSRHYWFSSIPERSALYVRYRSCLQMPTQPFRRFARSFLAARRRHEPERIVFDLRGNGGGNSGYLHYIMRPLQRRHTESIYCLVDEGVYSSGSMNAAELQRRLGATVVGSPSGGCPYFYGLIGQHTLTHCGLTLIYSRRLFKDPDDRPVGPVVPDVEIPRRFDDYAAGRDLALAHALWA